MTKDKILILGGGFIGQALARRITEEGKYVTVVSTSMPTDLISNVEWRQCKLDDPAAYKKLSEYQAVIHTASTSTPGHYIHTPSREVEDNLLPLLHFLEIMREHTYLPLLFISSGGAVYGNPNTLPVPESHELAPVSNHAAGKAAAEHFLGVLAHHGNSVIVLRPSNIYGPTQPLKPGFGIIRTFLEHAKLGTPITIWGDGEAIRDYLYIDDLLDACMAILKTPSSGTFNIGSGKGYSINELCLLIEQISGKALNLIYQSARSVDVQKIVLDNTAICRRYSWDPQITIEQGIRSTWEWLQFHS